MATEVLDPLRKLNIGGAKVPEIAVLLDKSGSMAKIRNDAIGAFNSFLEDQKRLGAEAYLTLVVFESVYEVRYDRVPIADAQPLTLDTYAPMGGTALIDSAWRLIAELENRSPDAVVLAIITDGEENASEFGWLPAPTDAERELVAPERGRRALNARITANREKGWLVLFLAANQDAIKVGASYGIGQGQALNFAANAGTGSVGATAGAMSNKVASYRSAYVSNVTSGRDASLAARVASNDVGTQFTDDERVKSMTGDATSITTTNTTGSKP